VILAALALRVETFVSSFIRGRRGREGQASFVASSSDLKRSASRGQRRTWARVSPGRTQFFSAFVGWREDIWHARLAPVSHSEEAGRSERYKTLRRVYALIASRRCVVNLSIYYINKGVLEEAKRSHHVRREGLEIPTLI